MRKLIAAFVTSTVAVAGLAVAAPAAQAHGPVKDHTDDIQIMKVVDTKKKNRSRIVVRYSDQMRGEVFAYFARQSLTAGMRKRGPWINDGHAPYRSHLIGDIARDVVLPEDGNTVKLRMPWDVGRWPGKHYKRKDAMRYTWVFLTPYEELGANVGAGARIMTARRGDPANYFWQRNRVARVWDTSVYATHHHRLIVR